MKSTLLKKEKHSLVLTLLVVVGILVYASANGNGKADRIINNENYRCSKY